jgi:hypothetical protein
MDERSLKGRKPTARNQADKIREMHSANIKAPVIAAQIGVSERSVYRVLAA